MIEKVTTLWNVQKKIDNFSQKVFLKINNETNKQEQNISLDPKKKLLDNLHGKAFKATLWLKYNFSQPNLKQNEKIR